MSESTLRPPHEPGSRLRYRGAGDRTGQVEVGAFIGAGSRCIVQEATDTRSGRELVVKSLRPELAADAAGRQRFTSASQALLGLEHPATARVLGVGDEPLPFRVEGRIEHETLAARLARDGQLPADLASRVIAQLGEALSEGHRHGLGLGTLEASHLFLSRDGNEVKLSWPSDTELVGAGREDGAADFARLAALHAQIAQAARPISEQSWVALSQRAGDFGERLQVGQATLQRVAELDIQDDRAAMEAMAFRIEGEADKWRSRQERSYASGPAKIVDTGLHQLGGRASFVARGLLPGRDLLIVSRVVLLDRMAAHELWVDGVRAEARPASSRRQNAWHNLLYVVPGALIGRGEARLELRIEAQEFQHYHYWLYQPVVDTALGPLPASLIRDGSGPG